MRAEERRARVDIHAQRAQLSSARCTRQEIAGRAFSWQGQRKEPQPGISEPLLRREMIGACKEDASLSGDQNSEDPDIQTAPQAGPVVLN